MWCDNANRLLITSHNWSPSHVLLQASQLWSQLGTESIGDYKLFPRRVFSYWLVYENNLVIISMWGATISISMKTAVVNWMSSSRLLWINQLFAYANTLFGILVALIAWCLPSWQCDLAPRRISLRSSVVAVCTLLQGSDLGGPLYQR